MTSLGLIPIWFVITVFAIILPELSNIVDLKFDLNISSFLSTFLKPPKYMAFEEKIIDIIKNTKKITKRKIIIIKAGLKNDSEVFGCLAKSNDEWNYTWIKRKK